MSVEHPDEGSRIIGLISDTHGLVRADVHRALGGVELILHAGDVGGDEVLDELALIAPVLAVFGNTDPEGDPRLSQTLVHAVGGVRVRVTHGHELGMPSVAALLARYPEEVIVFGHTHRQLVREADGRLVVNPGAAGPRRFDVVPSVARLTITRATAEAELVTLRA